MANRRQKKKAQKRAQKEAQRQREQASTLEDLALSTSEKSAVDAMMKKAKAEDEILDQEVEKEIEQENKAVAKKVKIPKVPPTPPQPAAPTTNVVKPAPEATTTVVNGGPAAASSNVTAPNTRSIFQRAKEAPQALSSVIASTLGNIKIGAPTAEQKQTRSEIVKINNQLIMTTKIIDSNKEELAKLAATDSNVAKILEISSSDQLKAIKSVQDRILAGNEISSEESKALIEQLESVTHTLSSSQVSLEAKFSDISDNFTNLILDNNLDRDDRRAMIDELLKISKNSEIQNQLTEEQKAAVVQLEALSGSNVNFSAEQNTKLAAIFKQLKSEDTDRVKLRGTLNDLNESMESVVLTEEALRKKFDSKDDKGDTLREKAGEGIKSLGKTLKAGAIDFLLSKVGLGGLGIGESLSEMGIGGLLSGGIGAAKGIGKFGGKAVGMLGKGAGMLGKGLGFAGKLAGKAALPLAAAMALYDGYQGWNNADEIAGTKPGTATTGQKFKAAGASVVSGLSFGLLDTKDVYGGIEKGIDFLFGEDGILTKTGSFLKKIFEFTPLGFVIMNFDSIRKGFMSLFGEEGIISRMGKFLSELPTMIMDGVKQIFESPDAMVAKIKDGLGFVFEFLFGKDGVFSMNTAKKALKGAAGTVLPSFISNKLGITEETPTETASVSAEPTQINTSVPAVPVNAKAADLARQDEILARQQREEQLSASKENKTVVMPAMAPSQPPPQQSRSSKVDDIGLAVMNAGMAGI